MGHRSKIHFRNNYEVASIYLHWSPYEAEIDDFFESFFKEVESQTKDTRFSDPGYLASKFIVWNSFNLSDFGVIFEEVRKIKNNISNKEKIKICDNILKIKGTLSEYYTINPLDFLSMGVSDESSQDDLVYEVDVKCNQLDSKGRPSISIRRT